MLKMMLPTIIAKMYTEAKRSFATLAMQKTLRVKTLNEKKSNTKAKQSFAPRAMQKLKVK